jgi:hypothetical protein
MVDRAGLDKRTSLIVTSNGKYAGWLWSQLINIIDIKEHLGDNLEADIKQAKSFGVHTRHTAIAEPNPVEKVFLRTGLRDLALVCREARLSIPDRDQRLYDLKCIQASLNLPMLIAASIHLARHAYRQGYKSILFSSRDCNLWLPVFRAVAKHLGFDIKADYFYTSRISRISASPDYRAYVKSLIQPDTVVVDICGSGWSLAHMFENLGMPGREIYLFHQTPRAVSLESIAPAPHSCAIISMIQEDPSDGCNNRALECLNQAEHGMVVDMRRAGNTFVPVFAIDRRHPDVRATIEAQQKFLLDAVKIFERSAIKDIFWMDDESLKMIARQLYQILSAQKVVYDAFSNQFNTEEPMVLASIAARFLKFN